VKKHTTVAIAQRTRWQPHGVTIDSQTLEDQTVTVTVRDTMVQERIGLDRIEPYLAEHLHL
jgi:glycyl-tRNA synthetase